MTATTQKILWRPFFEAMQAAGLLPEPETCRRMVIDAEVGKAVRITYHRFADTRILGVVADGAIQTTDEHDGSVVR